MAETCPCGSGTALDNCCLPIIQTRSAKTAEQLMRSRYTAFVLCDRDYLLDSWAAEARPAQLELDPNQRWLGLKVKRVEQGDITDSEGIVEFVARYKVEGRGHRIHETSRFRKEGGKWLYVSGGG